MSKSRTTTRKLAPIHPGDVLADAFQEAGVSPSSAAVAMGLPSNTMTRIINHQRSITASLALRIARYFGTSPDLWLGIQSDYDLEVAKDKEGAYVAKSVRPLRARRSRLAVA
jgi:addiction module HigA family antidote